MVLNLSACSILWKPDYRLDVKTSISAMPKLPVRVSEIQVAIDPANEAKIINHCYRSNRGCSEKKPYDDMKNAFQAALAQALAQNSLFSDTPRKNLAVKATFLQFGKIGGFAHYANVIIRYQFIDLQNNQVIYTTEINSTERKLTLSSWWDSGSTDHQTKNRVVRKNIEKLLRQLANPKKNQKFFIE